MNLRHIPLKNAYNVRDLGGYPTLDGRYTRWGLLYRSDALSNLTKDEWEILSHCNIKTVIDLRSSAETSSAKITPPENTAYYHFSLMRELDTIPPKANDQGSFSDKIVKSMELDYGKTLFGNLTCCADILHTISDRLVYGSVLFLCSAGKDRTGIIAAVLLYLCNVVREDMIADYIVSNTYNTNGINQKLSTLPADILKFIPDVQMLKSVLESKPETIIRLLDEMDSKDIRTALADAGFSLELQDHLKDQFTEPVEGLLSE